MGSPLQKAVIGQAMQLGVLDHDAAPFSVFLYSIGLAREIGDTPRSYRWVPMRYAIDTGLEAEIERSRGRREVWCVRSRMDRYAHLGLRRAGFVTRYEKLQLHEPSPLFRMT
jgi:hypothetical protein